MLINYARPWYLWNIQVISNHAFFQNQNAPQKTRRKLKFFELNCSLLYVFSQWKKRTKQRRNNNSSNNNAPICLHPSTSTVAYIDSVAHTYGYYPTQLYTCCLVLSTMHALFHIHTSWFLSSYEVFRSASFTNMLFQKATEISLLFLCVM